MLLHVVVLRTRSKKRKAFRKRSSITIAMCFAWPQLKSADIWCYNAPKLHHSSIGEPISIWLSNMPRDWRIGSLPEWGGKFEPVLSGFSSGAHMFYGWYVMGPMCIFFSFLARRTSPKRGTAHSLHHVYTRPIEPVFIFSRTIRNNYLKFLSLPLKYLLIKVFF